MNIIRTPERKTWSIILQRPQMNHSSLEEQVEEIIEEVARKNSVKIVGKIPFDETFTYAMIQAKTIFEYSKDSQASIDIRKIWNTIIAMPEFNTPAVNNIFIPNA